MWWYRPPGLQAIVDPSQTRLDSFALLRNESLEDGLCRGACKCESKRCYEQPWEQCTCKTLPN
eukprot:COSAG02_NODE_2639_length_8352_cov_5.696959_8_plen_63_part_00